MVSFVIIVLGAGVGLTGVWCELNRLTVYALIIIGVLIIVVGATASDIIAAFPN